MLALLLITFLYFTPTIVAIARKAPDTGSVVVLNLFFGWTFVGWVISLAMAARTRSETSFHVNVQTGLAPGYAPAPALYGGRHGAVPVPPYGEPALRPPAPPAPPRLPMPQPWPSPTTAPALLPLAIPGPVLPPLPHRTPGHQYPAHRAQP